MLDDEELIWKGDKGEEALARCLDNYAVDYTAIRQDVWNYPKVLRNINAKRADFLIKTKFGSFYADAKNKDLKIDYNDAILLKRLENFEKTPVWYAFSNEHKHGLYTWFWIPVDWILDPRIKLCTNIQEGTKFSDVGVSNFIRVSTKEEFEKYLLPKVFPRKNVINS